MFCFFLGSLIFSAIFTGVVKKQMHEVPSVCKLQAGCRLFSVALEAVLELAWSTE